MSKSTLSTLKSEINMESKSADSTASSLKSLDKSILDAMDDRVGHSASESLTSIYNSFSYNINKGYKSANNAVDALDRGYSKIDGLLSQGDKHLAQAKSIVKGLGEL